MHLDNSGDTPHILSTCLLSLLVRVVGEEGMSEKIRAIVEEFTQRLTEALREEVRADLVGEFTKAIENVDFGLGRRRAPDAPAVAVSAPVSRKKKKRAGIGMIRPCPVPGCTGKATPRYQMVCPDHSSSLTREEILTHREAADLPGGIWTRVKEAQKETRGRPRKEKEPA